MAERPIHAGEVGRQLMWPLGSAPDSNQTYTLRIHPPALLQKYTLTLSKLPLALGYITDATTFPVGGFYRYQVRSSGGAKYAIQTLHIETNLE